MLGKDVGDPEEDSGDVGVGVAETDRVLLVVADGAEVDLREVDGSNGGAAVNELDQGLRDLDTDHRLCLLGRASDVGGEKGVRAADELGLEEFAVGSGLLGEDIDSSTAEVAGAKCLGKGGDLDNGTAGGVDEERALLHLVKLVLANHVLGILGLGDVEGDKVGFGEEVREGVDLLGGAQGHQGDNVIEENTHTHRLCENRQLRTDMTVSDNS